MKLPVPTLFAGLFLLWGAVACTDDAQRVPEPEFFIKAQKNGTDWGLPATGVYVKKTGQFSLGGYARSAAPQQEFLRLEFALAEWQPLPAALPLTAEWGQLVGGDVLSDSYTAAEAQRPPSFEITRLDTVAKIVEGRFETVVRRGKHWTKKVEEIEFTNGSFRVAYKTF